MKEIGFFEKVYLEVKKIPKGKVATYGDIARRTGNIKASRAVGFALHRNPQFIVIPCHRVVNRNGMLAESFVFGGKEEQKSLLESEGVKVSNDFRVDLTLYRVK